MKYALRCINSPCGGIPWGHWQGVPWQLGPVQKHFHYPTLNIAFKELERLQNQHPFCGCSFKVAEVPTAFE